MRTRVFLSLAGAAGLAVLVAQLAAGDGPGPGKGAVPSAAPAGGGNAGGCTPSTGPDVIVGDLFGIARYGTIGGISAYAFGTTSCNIGNMTLDWDADTRHHPVIAQNLYRLKDGRFEQMGMSWLKHGFAAVTGDLCCTCQNPGNGQVLGVGCSDPYASSLNGDQDGTVGGCGITCGGLGPRYEVNASTGFFEYPYDTITESGDAIYKRLQVAIDDLDPAPNAGALYFGEAHYVTPDDAAAGNHNNNASYEQVVVDAFQQDSYILLFVGDTTRELPAIYAWRDADPQVVIEVVDDQSDGRFHLGYRVTDNGDGTWHYEYALHNLNSHRSAASFSVPVPAGVTLTGIGFHDVDYHSGDGNGSVTFDGTDWAVTVAGGAVTWSTQTEDADANANALRWGTLYNFRFDADTPPLTADATVGLYRGGDPSSLAAPAPAPAGLVCPWDLDGDGSVGINDFLELIALWGTDPGGPPDFDGDGTVGITDFLELLTRWGDCPTQPNCGDPTAGSCFKANGTPGCSQLECCETVCAVDPLCCTDAWDEGCKTMANELCGLCGDPGAGDCCVANLTPGCDDAECCRIVCEVDPVCCASGWDGVCALEAQKLCNCP